MDPPPRHLKNKILELCGWEYNQTENDGRSALTPSTPRTGLLLSPMRVLPDEIIQIIAKKLSDGQVAALALTSYSMAEIVGTTSWPITKTKCKERSILLDALESEHPIHFISCHQYREIHTMNMDAHSNSLQHYNENSATKKVLACSKEDFDNGFLYQEFSSALFQIIMKRHRLGLDCQKELEQLFPKYLDTEIKADKYEKYVFRCEHEVHNDGRKALLRQANFRVQRFAEARIQNSRLILHFQHQFMLSSKGDEEYRSPVLIVIDICSHINLIFEFFQDDWEDTFRKPISTIQRPEGNAIIVRRATSRLPTKFRCQSCRTDTKVEMVLGRFARIEELRIHRWMDLGEGKPGFRDEGMWKARPWGTVIPNLYPYGLIKAQFEDNSERYEYLEAQLESNRVRHERLKAGFENRKTKKKSESRKATKIGPRSSL